MRGDSLVDAACRIADGQAVDWPSITATLGSDEERALADELALVARIAAGHRQLHQLLPPGHDEAGEELALDRSRWGHLELLDVLGRGSYGTVYRAWDTRLERLVALKLFHGASDPEAVMQEGRMLARIRHENVVTVHGADVVDGIAGIWMEFVHGQTLDQIVKERGPMGPMEAAAIGVDVARALAAIHGAQLLHCDVKAQNVVREASGRVVLMDMGAGRVMPAARDDDQLSDVAGTPRYMAPELFVTGATTTAATDVYSVGVLLYYLVSARFPVDGRSFGELKKAHTLGRIAPLEQLRSDLPAEYLNLVSKALDRDPAQRPASPDQVRSVLAPIAAPAAAQPMRRWGWVTAAIAVGLLVLAIWRPGPLAPQPVVTSIAVMPIKNLTGDPSKAYVADGLTDVLISNLARIRSLRVPSFAAVASLRDSSDTPEVLARKLGVHLLLSGSITVAGSLLRLSVQITDSKGTRVWSDEISRETAGITAAQVDIARKVAAHLALSLSPEETRALAQVFVTPPAQEAYLRGMAALVAAPANVAEAAAHFREATTIAPDFAPPWAERALAETFLLEETGTPADRAERADAIRRMATRAIALDPALGRGYAALGTVEFYYDWDFTAAEQTLRRGMEVAPSDGLVRQRLAMLLAALGKLDDAIALGREGQIVEPLVPFRSTSLAALYYYARNYQRAEEEYRRALDLSPKFAVAHFGLGRLYAEQRRPDDALSEIEQAVALVRLPEWLVEYARVLIVAGRPADAQTLIAELLAGDRKPSPDQWAYIAAAQGQVDRAFEILDEAVRQRSTSVLWIAVDPRVDALRADSRFDRLLRRIGLR